MLRLDELKVFYGRHGYYGNSKSLFFYFDTSKAIKKRPCVFVVLRLLAIFWLFYGDIFMNLKDVKGMAMVVILTKKFHTLRLLIRRRGIVVEVTKMEP